MEKMIKTDYKLAENMDQDNNQIENLMIVNYLLKTFKLIIIIINISFFLGMFWLIYCDVTMNITRAYQAHYIKQYAIDNRWDLAGNKTECDILIKQANDQATAKENAKAEKEKCDEDKTEAGKCVGKTTPKCKKTIARDTKCKEDKTEAEAAAKLVKDDRIAVAAGYKDAAEMKTANDAAIAKGFTSAADEKTKTAAKQCAKDKTDNAKCVTDNTSTTAPCIASKAADEKCIATAKAVSDKKTADDLIIKNCVKAKTDHAKCVTDNTLTTAPCSKAKTDDEKCIADKKKANLIAAGEIPQTVDESIHTSKCVESKNCKITKLQQCKELQEQRDKQYQPEYFIEYFSINEMSNTRQAIVGMYYSFTSLTTVGFGDYNPRSEFERIFCAMILLFGVAIFSYIMGNFIEILEQIKQLDEELDDGDNLTRFFGLLQRFNGNKSINLELR